MRPLFITALLALFAVPMACAQDDMDMDDGRDDSATAETMARPPMRATDEARPSPNAGVMATIGTTNVMVHYGRPSLNDRTYFAAGATLAPAGQVWRTGANEAATILFSKDVVFGGEEVPAGTYSLFAIPGDTWTVILNDTAEQWGAFNYDEGADRVRVSATPIPDAPMQPQFEIRFENVTTSSALMLLHWGTVGVPVEIAEAE